MTTTVVEEEKSVALSTASAAPLGLAGFGVTTIVFSAISAGLAPPEAMTVVIPLAFAYGGLGQIITGILEFRNGNTFGTAAYTSFGLFWWWYALLQWTTGAGWMAAPAPEGIGIALLTWGLLAFGLWVATFRTSVVVWSIFLLLWVTFFLLGAASFGAGTGTIGAWVGLVLGLEALYLSVAQIVQAMYGRDILPLGGPILRT